MPPRKRAQSCSAIDPPPSPPNVSSRAANKWQMLRSLASAGVVVAQALTLYDQLQDLRKTGDGLTAKHQPATRLPTQFTDGDFNDDSDAESDAWDDGCEDDDDDYFEDTDYHQRGVTRLAGETVRVRATAPGPLLLLATLGKRVNAAKPKPRASIASIPTGAGLSSLATPITPARAPPSSFGIPPSTPNAPTPKPAPAPASGPSRSYDVEQSRGRAKHHVLPYDVRPPADPAFAASQPATSLRRGGGIRSKSRAEYTPAQRAAQKAAAHARRRRSLPAQLATAQQAGVAAGRRLRSHVKAAATERRLDAKRMLHVLDDAATVEADFPISSMLHGSSFYTGLARKRAADGGTSHAAASGAHPPPPKLHPRCNTLVKNLVQDEGYTYVSNDPDRCQPFVDSQGKMFAVKAKQPTGDWYSQAVSRVTDLLHDLRKNLHIAPKSANSKHTRGDWVRMNFGVSHGGGQKRPTRISPDWTAHNEGLIQEFLSNADVVRVLQHVESVVFTFYPALAKIYKELEQSMDVPDAIRTSVQFNLPFAAHTLNLGPYVRCWFHRDARNFILGICPVLVLGKFNPKTSGQFIMVEPKIVLELCPGDVLLMMSALLTHGTAPLRRYETRLSWTCYSAGGLFRYWQAGQRLVADLTPDQRQAYDAASRALFLRAWQALHTLDELKDLAREEISLSVP